MTGNCFTVRYMVKRDNRETDTNEFVTGELTQEKKTLKQPGTEKKTKWGNIYRTI